MEKIIISYNDKVKEVEIANLKSAELSSNLEKLKLDLQIEPSTSSGFKGFTVDDKMKAIEDLITMQGRSMQLMTESFKSINHELIKKSIKSNPRSESSRPSVPVPKQSYAEALMKRNTVVIKSRNITIKNPEDESSLFDQIKKDKLFNGVSVEKV